MNKIDSWIIMILVIEKNMQEGTWHIMNKIDIGLIMILVIEQNMLLDKLVNCNGMIFDVIRQLLLDGVSPVIKS